MTLEVRGNLVSDNRVEVLAFIRFEQLPNLHLVPCEFPEGLEVRGSKLLYLVPSTRNDGATNHEARQSLLDAFGLDDLVSCVVDIDIDDRSWEREWWRKSSARRSVRTVKGQLRCFDDGFASKRPPHVLVGFLSTILQRANAQEEAIVESTGSFTAETLLESFGDDATREAESHSSLKPLLTHHGDIELVVVKHVVENRRER